MDKKLVLDKYKNPEEKLLVSKFFDKLDLSAKNNKIELTDFFNEHEQTILKNIISLLKLENCMWYGGFEECERKIIIIYPNKLKAIFELNNFKFDTILSVFRITLPKEKQSEFNHSVYLGGLIKLGINRSKIGDIITYENGADIIVKKEIEKFLYANLKSLTRFSKSKIDIIKLSEIIKKDKSFLDIKIITSSLRLDNIVAELAKTSRNKAIEILNQERVFVNYENETKNTKQIKENDIITIRGKGKFIIFKIEGNTRKGNFIINIKKYV